MKIGFSGTRIGMSKRQYFNFVRWFEVTGKNATEFRHGDCLGSDDQAAEVVAAFRIGSTPKIISHPPINERLRAFAKADEIRDPKSYVARDKDIATETDILVITPKDFARSGGTWITANESLKQGKMILCFYPDGTVEEI